MRPARISRALVLRTAAVSAVAVALITSAGAQDAAWQKILTDAKKEGSMTPVSTVMSGKAAVAAMRAFRSQYGVSLEFFPGRIGAAVEKIITEQKSRSYITDSLDTHGIQIVVLKKGGYLQSVAQSLPALKEKDKFSRGIIDDPEGQLLNIAGESTYVCVNSNLVKPGDEPHSYRDLLNPKWKGKIILLNPLYNSSPDEVMLALTKAGSGLDEDFFRKLYQNAAVGGPGGADEVMDRLVRGEFAIGGFFSGSTALRPIRDGAPVKILDLKEGYVFKTVRIAAMKNMPHPNATRVYFNWLLTKEGQTLIAMETGLEPLRTDVAAAQSVRLKGPRITLTYDDLIQAQERSSKNYMANLMGLRK
jgi:iron(III) transport system substrate-binding protein